MARALRQLQLNKQLEEARAKLEKHRSSTELSERRSALEQRKLKTREAFDELTAEATEEQRNLVDDEIAAIEAEEAAIEAAETESETTEQTLASEVARIESELNELVNRSKAATAPVPQRENSDKKGSTTMSFRSFREMNYEERSQFFAQDEVKTFIENVRTMRETRGVKNATLTIPDVMFDVLRNELEGESKLISRVTVKAVSGTARQNIIGEIPEAVWMEAVGTLNELDLSLNQITTDGFLVGGFIAIPNSYLEDSDMALGTEIMTALRKAIGKALDNAILFGTGVKMPIGIMTRLQQTAQPESWDAKARPWTDLHESNIVTIDADGLNGVAFYTALLANAGIPSPDYSKGALTWIMNRKTHLALKTKAMEFNASAVLAAGVGNEMPVVGGEIVEVEKMEDNQILFGYFDLYLLVEREGAAIESSDQILWLQNQTCFKGYARFDGKPVFGEAFCLISFDNSEPVTSGTFPIDYANTALGVLGVTAAAHASTSGATVLTVTGTEASGTTIAYKIGAKSVTSGDRADDFTAFTSGTTAIKCAAGKTITVVELDADSRVIKMGTVVSVPKA
ncbi:MAG: phage major capsid protein [Clostridia bacterium]|nr:phage major capsid protein [Clostridia bacterium]